MKRGSLNELVPSLPEEVQGKSRPERRRFQRQVAKIQKWQAAGVRASLAPWQKVLKSKR